MNPVLLPLHPKDLPAPGHARIGRTRARVSRRSDHANSGRAALASRIATWLIAVVMAAFGFMLATPAHSAPATPAAPALTVVAAENFYADVARQIGGAQVAVTSILSNPDQDPHLFEASPKTARALQQARVVVYNGADYDPWMAKLLSASPSAARVVIVAAPLVGKKAGDNPHLWYDPRTMPALARALSAAFSAADPAHRALYEANLATFVHSLAPLDAKIAALRQRYAGTPVTATEPVFGYMASAIGLEMRNLPFQMATMNGTEASASDIAAFERDLKTRRVRVLIYNRQAVGALTQRMLKLAQQAHVPTVSVTETQPPAMSFQQWMLAQLNALDAALAAQNTAQNAPQSATQKAR